MLQGNSHSFLNPAEKITIPDRCQDESAAAAIDLPIGYV